MIASAVSYQSTGIPCHLSRLSLTMALTLTLRSQPLALELQGVIPERLEGLSNRAIADLEVQHGNRRVPLGEFFRVEGSAADGVLTLDGDCRRVHWIGAGMSRGRIRILEHAGRHVGSELAGGVIEVGGNAGDWLGAHQQGGTILVKGDVGNQCGCAYRGNASGMRGGTILIHGSAGDECGRGMRRGLIAIAGDVGHHCGYAMRAGTVVVRGGWGRRAGAGMIRGSLIALGQPPSLLPTFRHAGCHEPLFPRLLAQYLQTRNWPHTEKLRTRLFDLHHGDMLSGGRGEVWTAAADRV